MSMQAKLQRPLLPCVATLCTTLTTPTLAAEDRPEAQPTDLGDLSIEQLMDISVTSVAKKRTRLSESAAAISVITQEDIARSGYTSIPELLRMVPGLDVARISANEWAISARGFNGHFANNAVNGVINIITKSAQETQGRVLSAPTVWKLRRRICWSAGIPSTAACRPRW